MISTYKLLGVEWDHAPLPLNFPIFTENRMIESYTADRNLFDLVKYERRVNISEIFSSSPDKLKTMSDAVKECDAVYINIDYEPFSHAKDIRSFYYLRVLQAIAYFENSLNNKTIMVMGSELAKEECREKWNDKKVQSESNKK
ncbi:MAG: hypothetical protein K6F77_07125 [Lachnospiraceae bacterium]|nr:hypothetical protein [Lachnospiraceae bacterium]